MPDLTVPPAPPFMKRASFALSDGKVIHVHVDKYEYYMDSADPERMVVTVTARHDFSDRDPVVPEESVEIGVPNDAGGGDVILRCPGCGHYDDGHACPTGVLPPEATRSTTAMVDAIKKLCETAGVPYDEEVDSSVMVHAAREAIEAALPHPGRTWPIMPLRPYAARPATTAPGRFGVPMPATCGHLSPEFEGENYSCELPPGHTGVHKSYRRGAATPVEWSSGGVFPECLESFSPTPAGKGIRCVKPKGHTGVHRSYGGSTWPAALPSGSGVVPKDPKGAPKRPKPKMSALLACPETAHWVGPAGESGDLQCVRIAGHTGPHGGYLDGETINWA